MRKIWIFGIILVACTTNQTKTLDAGLGDQTEVYPGDHGQEVWERDTPKDEQTTALTLPNEPAPPGKDMVVMDGEYVQEFNHTLNETPWHGAVIAVVPVHGDRPLLVTPDQVVTFDGNKTKVETTGKLIAGCSAMGKAFVASENEVFEVVKGPEIVKTKVLIPNGVITGLYGSEQGLYVMGDKGVGLWNGTNFQWVTLERGPKAMDVSDKGMFLALDDKIDVYANFDALKSKKKEYSITTDVGGIVAVLTGIELPESMDLVVIGKKGIQGFNIKNKKALAVDNVLFHKGHVPLDDAVSAVKTNNLGFMVAAAGGVYRVVKEDPAIGPEYRVYVPKRWMPAGRVNQAVEVKGPKGLSTLYFATDKGLGWVTQKRWTLADKMKTMKERIRLRHDRDGAVADSHLTTPGDLSTNIPWDSDNDGGWTCYWVMSECMRYKVTGDPSAKEDFDRSLARMLSLRTLTGTDYFLARSVIRIKGCKLDDCDNPDDGEWFKSPDGKWWVKGDTSNDEVDSHMFMMGLAYDLCADADQKAAIRAHVDGIIGGILDHGYQLIDPQDGKCTTYGQFDPEYVNKSIPGYMGDGGLRSAEMIGALNLAYYLTKKAKYMQAKQELMDEYGYGKNIDHMGDPKRYPGCAGSGDCDELGMEAFFSLIRYESDPGLKARWMKAWNQMYDHLKLQEDPLWDMVNLVFEGKRGLNLGMRWFRRYPTDMIRWRVYNKDVRKDLIDAPKYYNVKNYEPGYKQRWDHHIIPPDERPNIRHNTPQYEFSGGWGSGLELDGADVLFAWWLGRYYGFIQ